MERPLNSEMQNAALRYAHLGLSVIPLRSHGKIPIFDEWQNIASKDEAVVSRWFRQNPNSNVGIATGPKSNCFVFDVDVAKGGRDSFETLLNRHGQFPDTWQQTTGSGGFHLFFRYPNFQVPNATDLFTGIDIRGVGGQVCAPPSIHPNGQRYMWDGAREIEETPLAEAPIWLLDLLHTRNENRQPKNGEKLSVAEQIPIGVRHKALVAMAGMLRRMGLNASEILPSLREVNRQRCAEPKPDAALCQIADSMMRYQPSDGNLTTVANRLWRVTKAREMEEVERRQAKEAEMEKIAVRIVDGLTVYKTPAAQQGCVVDGLLFNGLTLFAGSPKSGKSWLALQIALAVANGNKLFGQRNVFSPGLVIYAALEESEKRTSVRMRRLQPEQSIFLENISMVYSLLPLQGGGIEQLDEMAIKLSPSLLIVDTFLAMVGHGSKAKDVLRSEYAEMNLLHKLAERHTTAVLVVHHKRKAIAGSAGIDSVSGTAGMTAAADAIWTIDKEDGIVSSLSITGRDAEEQTLAIQFDQQEPFGWNLIGTGDGVKSLKAERDICTALREEGAQAPGKLAMLLRMNVVRVREILYDLKKRGVVVKSGGQGGQFYLAGSGSSGWENKDS